MTSLSQLREGFTHPPKSYGLLPLWDLNNDLRPDDIRWGLAEQAQQGISGIFLHPRSGMEVEYLSDNYWRAIADSIVFIRYARTSGMNRSTDHTTPSSQ